MNNVLRWGAAHAGSILAVCALALAGCWGDDDDDADVGPVKYAIAASVSGEGKITSPAGIDCGRACRVEVDAATSVTLTAAPAAGQRLQGWGGACASATGATCTVTVGAATAVSAAFVPDTHPLAVTVTGIGNVASTPAGIDCGSTCNATYAAATAVQLTATPAQGQLFQRWGGACASTTGPTCTVTLSQATAVTAAFGAVQAVEFALTVAVTGNGSVASTPAGIACGTTCSAVFADATAVQLTATPAQGQVLQAWGGACTGATATCTVTMSAARNVTATFAAASGPAPAWGTAALLENSNDFNVAGTNLFADVNVLSAIDAGGNALVIWQQSDGTPDGSTRKVWSRRYVAGQGWAPAVAVPGLLAGSSVNLVTGRLLMDAAGDAVWVRHDFQTRRYSATAGWSASAFVPAGSSGGSLADLTLGADGTVHLLGIGGSVLYSRLAPGSGQWTAWADVSQSTLEARQPQFALGAQGSVLAVWRERNPGDSNYSMKANRTQSGTWQTPVRIEELLTNVNDAVPRLASDAAGNAIAAWHQDTALYASRFDAATATWAAPTVVDTGLGSGSTFAVNPKLAMAPNGRAVLTWRSTFALKAASFTPGTGFTAPAEVNAYSAGDFVGIDAEGRAVAVYRAPVQFPGGTDATQNVYARELAVGGSTWSAATLLETGAGEVKDTPFCAINATGQVVCAWVQDDLPNDQVRNSLWATLRR